jgi:hypothetical protein
VREREKEVEWRMKGSQPQHTEDEATERELTSTQRKGGSGFIFIL